MEDISSPSCIQQIKIFRMKKISRYLTVMLIFLFARPSGAQNNTLALPFGEAMQMMKNNNPALQQAAHQIREKEAGKAIMRGLYLPKVSVGARAVLMSDPLHLDLSPVRDAILPLYTALGNYGVFSGVPNPDPATNSILPVLPDNISTQAVRTQLLKGADEVANAEWDQIIQEKFFATLSADLSLPLFSGGKIYSANKAAGVEIEISKEAQRNIEGELLSELVTRYYGLALGLRVLSLREKMAEAMNKHQYDAEKLYDQGMIARVELLNSVVAQADAEREYKQARRNIEILQQALSSTLSTGRTDSISPLSGLFVNRELPDVGFFVEKAFEQNPKLNQLEGTSQLVDIKHMVGKGAYLPSAALFGTYTLADYNKSPYSPDWVVGIGLNWVLFDGLSRHNELKKTTEVKAQVEEAREKAHNDISTYIFKLRQELSMYLEQIDELEKTLELATEYSQSTEKAFAQGLSTSTAVVDAQTRVLQVNILRLKVFYDYDTTLAKLLEIAGIPEQFLNYCSGENTIIEVLN